MDHNEQFINERLQAQHALKRLALQNASKRHDPAASAATDLLSAFVMLCIRENRDPFETLEGMLPRTVAFVHLTSGVENQHG